MGALAATLSEEERTWRLTRPWSNKGSLWLLLNAVSEVTRELKAAAGRPARQYGLDLGGMSQLQCRVTDLRTPSK